METSAPGTVKERIADTLDALDKARRGIAVYVLLVLGLSVACFFAAEPILNVLIRLLGRKLVAYNPAEGFLALASLALYCGITLSIPAGAWMLWRAATARWIPEWRRWGTPVIAIATALFVSGILLGYFVLLPAGIGFLVGFESEEVRALISARRFISFCGMMMLALGFSFEAPLVSFFLARIGWLKPSFFRDRWRHAILFCTVMAAVITPTPDVYNMTLMTMPLLGLYFVSFAVVWVADRRRKPPRAG
ncbi:MAG: twin-arginine translocase subunit TatC [Deltaproteobacteria bacterium]|nr:twin-arginine translocase subunit TatC [Deltaproteobacteria bacterium]